MLRLLSIFCGLVFVGVGAAWFSSPMLDAQLSAIAGPLVKAGTPKLSAENLLSVAIATLALAGVLMLAWAAVAGRSRATTSSA